MSVFVQTADGFETWDAGHHVPRHAHCDGYVALVLCGGYEECGSRGRFRTAPGDVLVHAAFDAHLNRFLNKATRILNLGAAGIAAPFGTASDPDAIARTAERDPVEAARQLRDGFAPRTPLAADWPDLLARDLLADHGCRLDHWAQRHGLTPETVTRGFRKVYGVTPGHFRLEARTRRALARITESAAPLADVAAACGFADQAHLTRSVRALTGKPPGSWRRSIAFKMEAARLQ